ncbi:hypothetical protein ACFQOY_13825 [Enterococcus alcedinis]|uniref:Uncharacterized protein n=1 Tax=Enterococcus alcedinis TaxID=1274384 RepID=A0A917N3N8_9ENTE|nr:hypothetical protein [Enterococcus alcedinis]MBP2100989.1 hypothetical protein [Enterococcus alcedinis]GGI64713.1 hypothetical protein GCM10011482_03670 [Enterococcus alcedinis]
MEKLIKDIFKEQKKQTYLLQSIESRLKEIGKNSRKIEISKTASY